MNETQLRQQAVMLIDQLSLADLKTVIGYLTNLKDREPTQQWRAILNPPRIRLRNASLTALKNHTT